jgi:hypothetical protein
MHPKAHVNNNKSVELTKEADVVLCGVLCGVIQHKAAWGTSLAHSQLTASSSNKARMSTPAARIRA